MRAVCMLLLSSLFASVAAAGEFDQPWLDRHAALILDPYNANPIDWEQLALDPRVVAIIHKATEGRTWKDPAYSKRKLQAKSKGYLWGSFHLGRIGDPAKQADFYIDSVQPGADELIALDLEDPLPPNRKFMSLPDAVVFIRRVKERVGRYPVVYVNGSAAKAIAVSFRDTEFTKTPLWYASPYRSISGFPQAVWPSYTLWQFSNELNSQISIPGVKSDIDVDVFNGSIEKLKADWPLTRSEDSNSSVPR